MDNLAYRTVKAAPSRSALCSTDYNRPTAGFVVFSFPAVRLLCPVQLHQFLQSIQYLRYRYAGQGTGYSRTALSSTAGNLRGCFERRRTQALFLIKTRRKNKVHNYLLV